MRKIHMMTPLLLVLCMLIMMPLASAKMVQVSDLGAYRFVERMNFFAKALDPPVSIDEPLHVGMMRPDSPYDIYATGQKYAVLSLFCNQAGYVSKITIQTPLNTKEGWNNATRLCALAVAAIGASKSEFEVLFNKRLANRHSSDVWCTAANRRIVLQTYPFKSTAVLRITAYDQ